MPITNDETGQAQVPTLEDDIGAIPLEGSGFEDQQPDQQENESEA